VDGKTVDGVDVSAHYHQYYKFKGGSGPLACSYPKSGYYIAVADNSSGLNVQYIHISYFSVTLSTLSQSLQNTTAPV